MAIPSRRDAWWTNFCIEAWAARHDFVFKVEPLAQSVARAKAMPAEKAPIFLLDHYDNCASGGTMDTTAVLAEILRQELDDVAFFGIYDPQAVRAGDRGRRRRAREAFDRRQDRSAGARPAEPAARGRSAR